MENIVELFATLAMVINRKLAEQDIRIKNLEEQLKTVRDEKLDAPLVELEKRLHNLEELTEDVQRTHAQFRDGVLERIENAEGDYAGSYDERAFKALTVGNEDRFDSYVERIVNRRIKDSNIATEDDITEAIRSHEEDSDHDPMDEDAIKELINDHISEHNNDWEAHKDGGQYITKHAAEELVEDIAERLIDKEFESHVDSYHKDDDDRIDSDYVREAAAKHEKEHHEFNKTPQKQAEDANIVVNEGQLDNMIFNMIKSNLESSGPICDLLQDMCSETTRTIVPEYVMENNDKWALRSTVLHAVTSDLIKDYLTDHYEADHKPLVEIAVLTAKVADEITQKITKKENN